MTALLLYLTLAVTAAVVLVLVAYLIGIIIALWGARNSLAKLAGGLVAIRCTAKGRILGVSIDDSLMKVEEKQILEDLVAAAFNDARAKADERSNAEMQKIQSGIGLPAGFKLPGMLLLLSYRWALL